LFVVERTEENSACVNHGLPRLDQLGNAVVVTLPEEVRDRIRDGLLDQLFPELAVVEMDLLGPVDLGEPMQAVGRKSSDDDRHGPHPRRPTDDWLLAADLR
jgi:hypothetical protein